MAEDKSDEARIFAVETSFQKLARRPGGISRQDAIRHASKKLKDVEPGFDTWLDDELRHLALGLQRIQNDSADAATIEAAGFRCRQLRDVGTTMNCELVSFVAGCLSDVLDALAAGAECDKDSIKCHADALLLARQKQYRHLKPEQVPELTAGLRRIARPVETNPAARSK
jgi:hypothetical protein